MKPPRFDYCAPKALPEVIEALSSCDNARIISGGQSLMPLLAFRLAAPDLLVDLKNVKGLDSIVIDDEGVRLGARVRWCDIERDACLRAHHPLLVEAVNNVAHYQIRNRGTVGGSLAHADPSAEFPCIALICDAEISITGEHGVRSERATEFFTGPLQTTLSSDEVVTEIRLPRWPIARRWAFLEFARRKGDFALAGVAIFYDRASDGTAVNAHFGAIGIADTPLRLTAAEAAIEGRAVEDTAIADAVAAAAKEIDPPSDIHAPGDYRRDLVGVLLERALRQSMA